MLTREKAEALKEYLPLILNSIGIEAVFSESDAEKLIWKKTSGGYDIPALAVGTPVRVGGAPYQCMKENRMVEEKVHRDVYGTRILMKSIPIADGPAPVGSFSIMLPQLHPVAAAFDGFAPMIADMFPEGSFLYITSLTKFVKRQPSGKFDIPTVQIDREMQEGATALKAIRVKKPVVEELSAEQYGVPILVMNYPLFDENDATQVVGTFGIATPRQNAIDLRVMANNLSHGLEEMSSVIQQLAASSSQITTNEQHLNKNILLVSNLSEEINGVLDFIKQIADQTKMLGLNAAIEAARAGDVGRGFGVVAEEIRKLSDESKSTVSKIAALTNNIKKCVDETIKTSDITLQASEEQAAASEEMSASIQEMASMAEQMDKMAHNM